MATQVQRRRGTTAEHANFIGAVGEFTIDLNKNTGVVHDGTQPGGYPLLREDGSNMLLSPGSLTSCALKFANDLNTGIVRLTDDTLGLVTGGVVRLTIDASGTGIFSGNVSIAGDLNVTGSATFADNIALIIALG